MKKRIMALVLVSVLVLSAAFTGCSSQTEEENPQNSSQSSQAEEPESSSEAEEPASEDGSSEGDAASAGDLPSSSVPDAASQAPSSSEPVAEGITGAVVMNAVSLEPAQKCWEPKRIWKPGIRPSRTGIPLPGCWFPQ